MGYDYDVVKSDTNCLFNMKENLKEKELREAQMNFGGGEGLGFNAPSMRKVG